MNQPRTGPLSPEQAHAYAICGQEKDYRGGSENLFLIGQVQVQVSKGRPYEHIRDSFQQIDPSKPVYDIRGTSVRYSCALPNSYPDDRRCRRTVDAHDKGICYQTTFNEWKCTWVDVDAPVSTDTRLLVPPPRESDVE